MDTTEVVVAGASGDLGLRVVTALVKRHAKVRALLRPQVDAARRERVAAAGATVVTARFDDADALARACAGASCVVSTLSGLAPVILDAQTALLNAAVKAGVPRFIPSDFSIDFTRLSLGSNRNFDLRRAFHQRLEGRPLAVTTVFNGMFADLLTGQAPFILFGRQRVLCWGDADQSMDFTTVDDTAAFTAAAALDPHAPRFLRVAGDQLSARGLARVASEVTGKPFRVLRPGGLGLFGALIRVTRALMPTTNEITPPWQGMQYMHNMFSGLAKLSPLDNDRYPSLKWTTVRAVLESRGAAS